MVMDLGELGPYNYEELLFHQDEECGLDVVLCIHNSVLGPPVGSTRLHLRRERERDIEECVHLAHAMTFKAAVANIPYGGAAAVIRVANENFDHEKLFTAYGRFLKKFEKRFLTFEDSGTHHGAMDFIHEVTTNVAGYSTARGGAGDPSRWTSLGVLRGMEACIKEKFNAHSFDGVTVAIQGVGHVGARLAHMLDNRGARLYLADHNHDQAVRTADRLGAQVVDRQEIHKVKCDVFAPCGIGPVIDHENVEELRCEIVAGSCSYQLGSQEVGKRLFERGILYAPDYAINTGGLFHVVVTLRGQPPTRANILTNGVYETIERIIDLSRQTHMPHSIVADIIARDKVMQTKARRGPFK